MQFIAILIRAQKTITITCIFDTITEKRLQLLTFLTRAQKNHYNHCHACFGQKKTNIAVNDIFDSGTKKTLRTFLARAQQKHDNYCHF